MREVLAFERLPMLATDLLLELHAARTGPLGRSVSCVGRQEREQISASGNAVMLKSCITLKTAA